MLKRKAASRAWTWMVASLTLTAACASEAGAAGADAVATARDILQASGVRGGLVVHVGCGDGRLTAALHASDAFLVHGLARDGADVERARGHIRAQGLYGPVSVDRFDGRRLPYANNLVRLLVLETAGAVPEAEMLRVLAPEGVACVRDGEEWKTTVKPRPDSIDTWTHYLHDASNNAVADDTAIGPPKRLRWTAGPHYCRSHEIDSSLCAMVTAGGRLFYIFDEGLTGITDPRLPPQWKLVARDADSGVLLWKRPMPDWGWRQWKPQWGTQNWTETRGHRTRLPIVLPRRLVTDGERVYATLAFDAPVSVLDAATGQVRRTLEDTAHTDEILHAAGTLVLCRRPKEGKPSLAAVDADTGQGLWEHATAVLPLSPAVCDGRVFFHDGQTVVCLDLETGRRLWRTKVRGGGGNLYNVGQTLVAARGVVLYHHPKELTALDAEDGEVLWTAPGSRGPGVAGPPDLFVAGGLVWAGGQRKGYDPQTGKVRRTIDVGHLISPGHHYRCYRSKATSQYLLWPKRGVEFLDLDGREHQRHDWLRAPCRYGVLPANGLLYVAPHQCFCYPAAKLTGFNALAAGSAEETAQEPEQRLVRGPAYGAPIRNPKSEISDRSWPTLRHDPRRTGATPTTVPAEVKPAWRTDLGGRLSAPVVAAGRLYVAQTDGHTLHCLDAATGQPVWSHTAGGRIDSPPTLHGGLALFGSRDGCVTCLRADDGALVWRFRAGPADRRIVAFGQVESAWPVPGSVLVLDGVAYAAAGRSSYLDGGIRVWGLEPATGKVLHAARLDGPWPDPAKDTGRPFDMEGTRNDVLTSDGEYLYLFQVKFNKQLERQEAPRITNLGDRDMGGRHVFATSSLLDDSWWNRTFWMYSSRWPGYYIANQAPKAGQILCVGEETTYAVKCYTLRNRHSPMMFPGDKGARGYLLFADANDNEPYLYDGESEPEPVQWLPAVSKKIGHRRTMNAVNKDKGTGFTRSRPPLWQAWKDVRIRAMVLAGDTLFCAGPPDVLTEADPLAAFEGRAGGRLLAASRADGTTLSETALDAPPVFDGLIAAGGRLYLVDRAGGVRCFGGD
ncbi:MAG: PQQ-binding-like beta-propeller repeat protein [Phycisphaerae bacterium]